MAYKIKSKYILEKIKNKSFSNQKDREFINNLIILEKHAITQEIHGVGHGIILHHLKDDLRNHWLRILEELNPKEYKRETKMNEREKLLDFCERQKITSEERKQEEREKKEWLKMGGKP